MSTVRHLGLFALPNIPFGGTSEDFLQGRLRCPQPAEAFTGSLLGSGNYTLAPADLVQSSYTAVDLNRAMLWLWRIKAFTVSGSLQFVDPESETTYTVNIGPFIVPNQFDQTFQPFENEKQKVCDCGLFYGFEVVGNENSDPGSHQIIISIANRTNMWGNYPHTPETILGGVGQRLRINQAKSAFFIPVFVDLSIWGTSGRFDFSSGSTTNSDAGTERGISWEITDSLGSLSKAFRFGGNEASGTINIEATEYWPYDPGDGGGPIYDSTTGVQLRPFPTN